MLTIKAGFILLTLLPVNETMALRVDSISYFHGTSAGCLLTLERKEKPLLTKESCEQINEAIVGEK